MIIVNNRNVSKYFISLWSFY